MVKKGTNTWFEDGTKDGNGLLAPQVEEICRKDNLKDNILNEKFVNVLKNGLHGILLPLLPGNIVQDVLFWSLKHFISVH